MDSLQRILRGQHVYAHAQKFLVGLMVPKEWLNSFFLLAGPLGLTAVRSYFHYNSHRCAHISTTTTHRDARAPRLCHLRELGAQRGAEAPS